MKILSNAMLFQAVKKAWERYRHEVILCWIYANALYTRLSNRSQTLQLRNKNTIENEKTCDI